MLPASSSSLGSIRLVGLKRYVLREAFPATLSPDPTLSLLPPLEHQCHECRDFSAVAPVSPEPGVVVEWTSAFEEYDVRAIGRVTSENSGVYELPVVAVTLDTYQCSMCAVPVCLTQSL